MPDLNSVPVSRPYQSSPSPQLARRPSSTFSLSSSAASSRRQSFMLPPPIPSAVPTSEPNVDRGPGPQRYPRPLTAADLHLQLEKEQEAVVNRLTRELSHLRAQTPSVSAIDSSDYHPSELPHSRARSSSTTSTHAPSVMTTAATVATSNRSRQGSFSGSARTGRSSPALSAIGVEPYGSPSLSSSSWSHLGPNSAANNYFHHPPASISGSEASVSYADAIAARNELEVVKRENEALRNRIRELERVVRVVSGAADGIRRGVEAGSVSRSGSLRSEGVRRSVSFRDGEEEEGKRNSMEAVVDEGSIRESVTTATSTIDEREISVVKE